MNKWNQLLKCLDQAYGYENQITSRFKTVEQGFDNKTGEHIVLLQYRVRRGDAPVKQKKKEVDDGKLRRANKRKLDSLLQDINREANLIVKTGAAEPLS